MKLIPIVVIKRDHPTCPETAFEYALPVKAAEVAELVWHSTTECSRPELVKKY